MPSHAPYIMPNGQSLTKYLTFETESGKNHGARRRKTRKGKRGKDEIWEHFKHHQSSVNDESSGYWSEKDEFKIVEKMGSRRRRRWLNDKMLRDMTGPMTRDQIEAQFCPPPWGDDPLPNEPFHLLFLEARSLWEMLINIDMNQEEALIDELKTKHRKERNEEKVYDPCGARKALRAWNGLPRRLRRILKSANPMVVLEMELEVMEFKAQGNSTTPSLIIPQQSRYKTAIYEGLCEFHKLRICWENSNDSELPLLDLVITKRKQKRNKLDKEQQVQDDLEIICSDLIITLQDMKSAALTPKTLREFVMKNIHGSENG
eukprot:g3881.t1